MVSEVELEVELKVVLEVVSEVELEVELEVMSEVVSEVELEVVSVSEASGVGALVVVGSGVGGVWACWLGMVSARSNHTRFPIGISFPAGSGLVDILKGWKLLRTKRMQILTNSARRR